MKTIELKSYITNVLFLCASITGIAYHSIDPLFDHFDKVDQKIFQQHGGNLTLRKDVYKDELYIDNPIPVPVYIPPSKRVLNYSEDDLECLAMNIYHEARNESIKGQKAVAWVTINRVNDDRYPDEICEVVWQHKQFSWTMDGLDDVPKNRDAWNKSLRIAKLVIKEYENRVKDPTEGAIMFHAHYVNPYWATEYAMVGNIDSHIFYK
jgi:spore germination cell wall hydrolase CwlJ-like protein